jgi:8-oxo-dGTP pyrophosphatase MutT (NUDIX family)
MERPIDVCNPCLAQLSSPRERLLALQKAILAESEPLITVTHLLRLCRDEHRVLSETRHEPESRQAVVKVIEAINDLISSEGFSTLLEVSVRRALSEALGLVPDVPVVLVAHALAELVDDRFGHTFLESFRRRSPYQPGVGDPIPLDNPDLRRVTAMRPTSPPWRLANRLDETRRVRLAGEWAVQFRIVFDYSIADNLDTLMSHDAVIATCHPNRSLLELDLAQVRDGRTFPIGPIDAARQSVEVNKLISQATGAGASIVVLPELCLTEEMALELQEWVRRPDGPGLLIAGSFHHEDPHDQEPGQRRRRNTAIAWMRGHEQPLLHDKHSPGDGPIVENIQPVGWPELRIYVSAQGWHLVIAICRDLLNPLAVNALAEAGANLVLVPAMSETLMAFGGPVAHLVGAGQAFVAVANNPGDWTVEKNMSPARHPARALFGHPGLGQQTRFVQPGNPRPGVALMRADSAQITWVPGASTPDQGRPGLQGQRDERTRPGWATRLMEEARDALSIDYGPERVALRQAAVLVLLTEGAQGPQVLLTERTSDLTDYPGQIVFPGGVAEPGDRGPVATALREATEEVGLDIHLVTVIDCLPPLALPDTGFVVHPVLAWAKQAPSLAAVNFAEVADSFEIPLYRFADRHGRIPAVDGDARGSAEPPQLGALTSAVIDMVLARLLRGEPSRGAAFGNHAVAAGTAPPAPWDTPRVGRPMVHQPSVPEANSEVLSPR